MSQTDRSLSLAVDQGEVASASPAEEEGSVKTVTSQMMSTRQASQDPPGPPHARMEALAAKKASLEVILASLQEQRAALAAQAQLPRDQEITQDWSEAEKTQSALVNANGVIRDHIALLSKYNEIKDIGQGLMGLIADQRGVRIATVMEEFGMDEKD